MKTIWQLATTIAVAGLLGIGLAGCNTIRGAGKDIQKGGQAVERGAENTEEAIKN